MSALVGALSGLSLVCAMITAILRNAEASLATRRRAANDDRDTPGNVLDTGYWQIASTMMTCGNYSARPLKHSGTSSPVRFVSCSPTHTATPSSAKAR